jgi:predicted amidohydrolase YtcJ
MKRHIFCLVICIMASFFNPTGARAAPPDEVFVADRIWTLDSARPTAEAVAVKDGVIVAVGPEEEILALARRETVVHRLKGAFIYPGFVDAHCHLLSLGLQLDRLDLVGTSSFEEIVKKVRAKTEEAAAGEWILGRGWDQNDWQDPHWPSKEELDRVSPANPVYLRRVDGHAAIANSKVLEIAGIDAGTPDPAGGKIIRENGKPTGVLIDRAMDLVKDFIPQPSVETKRKALLRAADLCMSAGLVGVHEAGVTGENLNLYRQMADSGEMPFYINAMVDGEDSTLVQILEAGPEIRRGGMLTIRSVKLYADGALGSRGAALLEPYSDEPDNSGLLMMDTDSLATFTENALRHGFQVCVHAIGDRANRVVLDAYERAMKATGVEGDKARLRDEHAQVISPPDIPRFGSLGVIASMQPTHCTSDMPWAPDRLGPVRIHGAYAWASLIEGGAHVAGGSDFPVESHDPLLGFYAAVTRQDTRGNPPGGWSPEERMTREQALAIFTLGAAYAAFEEDVTGSLEPGKRADMTVLSRDIMQVEPSEILDTEVVMTIVGGRILYEQEEVQ